MESPRIGGVTFRIQPTFITDTDAVPVMIPAVRTHFFQRTTIVYHPVPRDVEMITDVLKAPVADMVLPALFEVKALPLAGGRAMNND